MEENPRSGSIPEISFESLFNEVPCYISLQDRNLNIVNANRRFRENFGEDFLGRPCYEVYKKRESKCETCPVEMSFADGESHQSEETVQCLDGRIVQVLIRTTPIRNGDGEIVAVMEMSTNVSELKRLQNELDESRKLYHSLFENVPCFITVHDKNLKVIEANRLFRETFGEIGPDCWELCKGRDKKCDTCHVEMTFSDGESHRKESVVKCRDGRELNVISLTEPIRNEKGEITSVMELTADVTELKRLQGELDSSRKLYRSLFENVPCFITVHDKNLKVLEANRLFRETFGEIDGRDCWELCKGRNEKCEDCHVEMTFSDGESHRKESVVKCRDGRELNVISLTEPIRNDRGEITSVMELTADVTELKSLETALHDANKKLLHLFEEVPCFISVIDRDFKIVRSNRRFRESFGIGVGERCYEVYKHREEPCLECPVAATFNNGEVHQSEEVVVSSRGERINVLCYTTPIFNEKKEITHVMEMSTDITEIRSLQDQLTSLGLLVGSISHSIKGLLTGLSGGVYMLDSGFSRDDMNRVKKGWDMVKRNVDRIRRMILDVLYYAKEREPEYETIDIQSFAEEVCGLFEKKAAEIGAKFQHKLDPDLGTFEADPNAMRSLLVNILENSFEACRTDSRKDEHIVTFASRKAPDHIVFEISDNGIGMDRETRDKAFTLFFSSKGTGGTGLGLFISNKIAKKHGGKILLDSVPGTGSTFRVSIPFKKPDSD